MLDFSHSCYQVVSVREETLVGGPSGSKTSRAASPTSSILSNEILPVKKRPLSAEQTGLNLSSTPKKKRSEVADEFVSSAILHSITLPAHDSAHWVIGVMPQDDKFMSLLVKLRGIKREIEIAEEYQPGETK